MKPHISVITLGVNDLEKSLTFYRDGLGLQTHGIRGTEFTGDETHPSGAVVMFELQNGFILALYPLVFSFLVGRARSPESGGLSSPGTRRDGDTIPLPWSTADPALNLL